MTEMGFVMSVAQQEAWKLIEQGSLDKAQIILQSAIEIDPDNLSVSKLLAWVLYWRQMPTEALTVLSQIKVDAPSSETSYLMGLCYHNLKDYQNALLNYRIVIDDVKYSSSANLMIGMIYEDRNDENKSCEQARHYYQASVEADVPEMKAFYRLASLETGSRAINILKRGLSYHPTSVLLTEKLVTTFLYKQQDAICANAELKEAASRNVCSERLDFLSMLVNLQLSQYDEVIRIAHTILEVDRSETEQRVLMCLLSIGLLEGNQIGDAIDLLQTVIAEDIANRLMYVAHILLTCCYLRSGQLHEAEKIFGELPESEQFYGMLLHAEDLGHYEADAYLQEAVENVLTQSSSPEIMSRACGIRAMNTLYSDVSDSKVQAQKAQKDLVIALQTFPRNVDYNKKISETYEELGEWLNAVRYAITAQLLTDENQYLDALPLEKLYRNKSRFKQFIGLVEGLLADEYTSNSKLFARFFLEQVIDFLYDKNEFAIITKLAANFEYKELLEADILFDLAYAYVECGDKTRAAQYYEAYIRDKGMNASVANNLGLLREDRGHIEEAKLLFEQALQLDSNNKHATNNLKRVTEKLDEQRKQQEALHRAVHLFEQEDNIAKRALASIYEIKADDGLIYCKIGRVSSLLKKATGDTRTLLETFQKKRYLERVEVAQPVYDELILKLNTALLPQVQQELNVLRDERVASQVANELTTKNLDTKYGYNQELKQQLTFLASHELAAQLERDLREAVIALAIQSYKSALILCGSIAEAILLDILLTKQIVAVAALERIRLREGRKVSNGDKNLSNWALATLLDVAREEKIISENLFHWGHGIRGFRNLVHPAVEQRREMDVSRDNAEIAWSVVKRLLNELG